MCGNKQQTLFDLKYFVPKSFVTAHNDLSLSVYLNAAIGEYRYKSPLSDQYQSFCIKSTLPVVGATLQPFDTSVNHYFFFIILPLFDYAQF